MAGLLPPLAERLKLDEPNVRVIGLTREELAQLCGLAKAALQHTRLHGRLNSLVTCFEQALNDSQGIGAIPKSVRIFQFRITLMEITPPIWRRIQVRDCTLERFHEHIQLAFGWETYHLHQFEVHGERYTDSAFVDDFDSEPTQDSFEIRLSEIVPRDGNRFSFVYEYDFGDCWRHEVLFEGCLKAEPGQRYPLCVEGARCCPPEDCGGAAGYERYLAALRAPYEPEDGEAQEFLDWRGSFAPEQFDTERTTRRMRRGLPRPKDDAFDVL